MNSIKRLGQLLTSAQKSDLLEETLVFLLTPGEIEDIQKRLDLVTALLSEDETQRDMSARLDVSIAKITRGSNELKRCTPKLKTFLQKQLLKS